MAVLADRETYIENNLGLVHSCANRFRSRGIEYDDLFQAGCMGLVKAYDNFDESRGVMFSTYAVPVILGEIKRLFRDGGAIKVSRSLKELSMRVSKERQKFSLREGREPQINELAEILGLAPEQIAEAISASVRPMSLTSASDDENSGNNIDVAVPSVEDSFCELLTMKQLLKGLKENDRKLIELRYFRDKTQTQTGELLKMTQVQVSRREKKILAELKARLV